MKDTPEMKSHCQLCIRVQSGLNQRVAFLSALFKKYISVTLWCQSVLAESVLQLEGRGSDPCDSPASLCENPSLSPCTAVDERVSSMTAEQHGG